MDTTPCGGVTSYQSDRPLCLGIVVYFFLDIVCLTIKTAQYLTRLFDLNLSPDFFPNLISNPFFYP